MLRGTRRSVAVLAILIVACVAGASAQQTTPQILDVVIDPQPVQSGQVAHTIVTTSPDVTSVEAQVLMVHIPIPRVAAGRFELEKAVPEVPAVFRRLWSVTFIARGGDGSARSVVSVMVH